MLNKFIIMLYLLRQRSVGGYVEYKHKDLCYQSSKGSQPYLWYIGLLVRVRWISRVMANELVQMSFSTSLLLLIYVILFLLWKSV